MLLRVRDTSKTEIHTPDVWCTIFTSKIMRLLIFFLIYNHLSCVLLQLYAGSNEVGNHKKEAELRYRYFLKKSEKELYRYEVKEWGKCSKRCNGGALF